MINVQLDRMNAEMFLLKVQMDDLKVELLLVQLAIAHLIA
jgi:hypothetical protein